VGWVGFRCRGIDCGRIVESFMVLPESVRVRSWRPAPCSLPSENFFAEAIELLVLLFPDHGNLDAWAPIPLLVLEMDDANINPGNFDTLVYGKVDYGI